MPSPYLVSAKAALLCALISSVGLRAESISSLWDLEVGESTIAGYVDGVAAEARFSSPRGIDVDAAGNIFVADSGNAVIRKITPDGQVSTFAGTPGVGGYVNGPANVARFRTLQDLDIGPDGRIYVVDSDRIRVISPNGVVSTFAGGGYLFPYNDDEVMSASSVAIWSARGLAVDPQSNVFVATSQGTLKITPQGAATGVTGMQSSGSVFDLEADGSGNVYAVSAFNGEAQKRSPDGTVQTLGPDYAAPYEKRYVSALAAMPDGTLWAAQDIVGIIGPYTLGSSVEALAQFKPGEDSAAPFRSPWQLTAAPGGGVYLTDTDSHSVQHVAPDGTVTVIAGVGAKTQLDGHLSSAALTQPRNVHAPGNGYVYVMDNWRIRRVDQAAMTVETVALLTDSPYEGNATNTWSDFVVDREGNFYFANFPRDCVSRLTVEGSWSILAGVKDESEIVDGSGTSARFNSPHSITIDGSGNLYVADSDDGHVVRHITPGGTVTTIAGVSTERSEAVDGQGTAARFSYIKSIAACADDTVWVGEIGIVRLISPAGEVTTVAGDPDNYDPNGTDGVGPNAIISYIKDLAALPNGDAVVLESNEMRVRRVTRAGDVDSAYLAGPYATSPNAVLFMAVTADEKGQISLVDLLNRRVLTGMLTPDAGRLANLSVLKRVGDGGSKLTVGFVTEGTTPKPTLVRAIGPTLANYGVTSGFMPDPLLELFDRDGERVETNDDWGDANGLVDTTQRLGAVPLDAGTADAAVVREIPNGPFTATAFAADGRAGQVLVEVYDADLNGATRFTNVSTLTQVTPGDGRLIAGFVITGDGEKTVLIRGVGPSLSAFGIPASQVLSNPRIRLFGADGLIAENDDWAGAPLLDAAFNAVGAFAFADEQTADAALLLKLEAGNYSVHLESADGAAGQAIIEVYEVK